MQSSNYIYFFAVLGIYPGVMNIVGKVSVTEPYL